MPQDSSPQQRQLSAVFATLEGGGRAQRVEDRIIGGISAGILRDGDRLPSESELATSMGVATVTAREALVSLRARGLVVTRRGREGGTFITLPSGDRSALVAARLARLSRVELRDMAIHYAAICATAAELAALNADAEDATALGGLLHVDPAHAPGVPGTIVGNFLLELAALSQSARLTREQVRLHSEFGSLLSLAHADADFDRRMIEHCSQIVDAVSQRNSERSRTLVGDYIRAGVAWLIEAKAGLVNTVPITDRSTP